MVEKQRHTLTVGIRCLLYFERLLVETKFVVLRMLVSDERPGLLLVEVGAEMLLRKIAVLSLVPKLQNLVVVKAYKAVASSGLQRFVGPRMRR